MRQRLSSALVVTALAVVAACAREEGGEATGKKEYLGIQTVLLQGDMVSFRVAMKGAQDGKDIEDYARCAAAQYALIRGAGFARHVRTNVAKSGDTILLSAGNYGNVSLNGIVFSGEVTITSKDAGNPATLTGLTVANSQGLSFENLHMDYSNPWTVWNTQVNNSKNISFDNINFHGSLNNNPADDENAMLIRGSTNVTVTNSEFQELSWSAPSEVIHPVSWSEDHFGWNERWQGSGTSRKRSSPSCGR